MKPIICDYMKIIKSVFFVKIVNQHGTIIISTCKDVSVKFKCYMRRTFAMEAKFLNAERQSFRI